MLEFHDIIEGWISDASEGNLSSWKAALTRSHLRHCARCQNFAFELAEFNGAVSNPAAAKPIGAQETAQLHAEVMAAFHRQRANQSGATRVKKLQLRTTFGVTPGFAKAFGLVILGLSVIVMLAQLNQRDSQDVSANAAPKHGGAELIKTIEPPSAAASTATPTATTTPSVIVTFTPTPSASPQKSQKP